MTYEALALRTSMIQMSLLPSARVSQGFHTARPRINLTFLLRDHVESTRLCSSYHYIEWYLMCLHCHRRKTLTVDQHSIVTGKDLRTGNQTSVHTWHKCHVPSSRRGSSPCELVHSAEQVEDATI
jgi:hypothetical protein